MAQRLIAEMRRRVQVHIGRLPVAYYDANKTGALVNRIMTDVEGVRNLVGTGLVEFLGGLLSASIALALDAAHQRRDDAGHAGLGRRVRGRPLSRDGHAAADLPRARADLRRGGGTAHRVAGGVRVVKGYHAEEREADVFASGVGRLLANVLKTLTATSVMGLASTVLLGLVGAAVMYFGARQILAGSLTLGGFFTYTLLLGFLIAPLFQVVSIGTQLTEALAGLERTREVLREAPEDADPRRSASLGRIVGDVVFEDVRFAYEADKPVLNGISFQAAPGTVTALVGPRARASPRSRGCWPPSTCPRPAAVLVDGADLATVRLDSYRTQLGVVLQETLPVRRHHPRERRVLAARRVGRAGAGGLPTGPRGRVRGAVPARLRDDRGRAGRQALGRPAPARVDRAGGAGGPAHPDPGRGHLEPGLRAGGAHPGGPLAPDARPHDRRDRAPASTIRRADQILVVEGGRIVESGDHEALSARRGRYYEMYTKQHGLEANLFLAPGEGASEPQDNEQPADARRDPAEGPLDLLRPRG